MSLHQLANHMAAHGRGPDDHLVHMSGKEVAGLQALANMHGGSLTRNPQTGLPEAGFLDNLLPALVGGAAMYFTGGAAAPWIEGMSNAAVIGSGVGALQTARTGDLGKGIMAGLGAYGGAGMAGSAENAGLIDKFGSTPTAPVAPEVAQLGSPEVLNPADPNAWGSEDTTGQANLSSGRVLNVSNPAAWSDGTSAAGGSPITVQNLGGLSNIGMAAAPAIMSAMTPNSSTPAAANQMIRPYTFAANPQAQGNMVGNKPMIGAKYTPGQDTSERQWFNPQYTAGTPYTPVAGKDYAEGGIIGLASGGGPVEQMSNQNAIGANTQYPMADTHSNAFATPYQTPISQNILSGPSDTNVDPYTGEEKFAAGGGISGLMSYAEGGSLGGYSDGGQMLEGPGDGMSDSIPAQIGDKQPARLAQGEFVVPADVVSHLGNGSTDAGAKQLYKMMDKVRSARTGRKAQGKQINASKFVPA